MTPVQQWLVLVSVLAAGWYIIAIVAWLWTEHAVSRQVEELMDQVPESYPGADGRPSRHGPSQKPPRFS
ncbi:MAG: hypothetical protein ACR2IK_05310 [Chloroflexota bacterium]